MFPQVLFPTILPTIFSRLSEYLSNTHISPTVPIISRRIVQFFVSNLIARLKKCSWQWVATAFGCSVRICVEIRDRFAIMLPLRHTSGHGSHLNLSDTLTECPWLHLRWSRFWYCQVRKIRWNLLTRPNCHVQTFHKMTIVQYYWLPFHHSYDWNETFTLKVLDAMMCNNSFRMSWRVYLCATCPWRCFGMPLPFGRRRYKIWVRLSLLSGPCDGIPWKARYLMHLVTSSKYLRSTCLLWVIWSSISSSTSKNNQAIGSGHQLISRILVAVKTFWCLLLC